MMEGQRVNGKKARTLVDGGAKLVDMRNAVAFRDGTLPGAVNMSLRQISTLINLPKETKIVFFGETNEDENLKAAVNYAVQFGFMNVYTLGSKENWDR